MKKELRIINQAENHHLVNLVIGVALMSNKSTSPVTLKDIEGFCNCHIVTCPLLFKDVRIELVDHILFIEDNMEQVLELREIELFELDMSMPIDIHVYTEPSY